MPLALLKHAMLRESGGGRYFPADKPLEKGYDIVIIGGGGHGLACAYYLAKEWGIRNVAVLEKGWLASGNTARNTTIIRSNYLTPEGASFYEESMRLYRQLAGELGLNLMYSERGHLTLAHTDAAIRTSRWRAEVNKHIGIDSELVGPDELAKLCPQLNLSTSVRHPVLGALYHPPGAIARHDAVAWGYARGAMRRGVEIHQQTEVIALSSRPNGSIRIETNRGMITASKVVQAVAGMSSEVARMMDIKLPIRSVPLQACVSEPLLDPIVVSGSLHIYVSQSARGELVMGGSTDAYPLYSTRSTLDFTEGLMANMLQLFPAFENAKMMRQWGCIADMTPDFSPVMGITPVSNYYLDAGWGTWGFKATPISGKCMAELVATDIVPDLILPFALDRFDRFEQVGERGAASVGH